MRKIIFMVLCLLTFCTFSQQSFSEDTATKTCNDETCINSEKFMVPVSNLVPGTKLSNTGGDVNDTSKSINFFLSTVIQKMVIFLGIGSLITMIAGSALMIFYGGNDTTLSKGKFMFTAGIIALMVALSSYYIISLVRYIVYYK